MNMEELVLEIKNKIIEALNLKGMSPDEIDENAPLFKEGLGLELRHKAERSCGRKGDIQVGEVHRRLCRCPQDKIVFWRSVRGRGVSH